jgi:alanine dehydrogenase
MSERVSGPRWIGERDVEALSIAEAIDALRGGLRREATAGAANLEKTHLRVEGGANIHAIGAAFPTDGICGVKTWVHTKGGANPVEILWDSDTGQLLAVIEAFALGQLRTAAIAGIATDLLAAKEACEMALCGTGKQALAQVAAIDAVRPLDRVRVFGRDRARRDAMVARIGDELGLSAKGFDAVGPAIDAAPIVTLVTRASEPFIGVDAIAAGAHVNAMGAITPERCEFEPGLLARCAVVAVDNLPSAQRLASELRAFYSDDESWGNVTPLSELVASKASRPAGADLTLFKSLGMGISDLALATEIYRRAVESGAGLELPQPEPRPLVFGAAAASSPGSASIAGEGVEP